MDQVRWQKIEELFNAALARPVSERRTFLADACAGDDALSTEIESLLLEEEQPNTFLSEATFTLGLKAVAADDKSESLVGNRLGPYLILSILGKGGMGEVYLAHDPRLGRKVAIKLLPLELT